MAGVFFGLPVRYPRQTAHFLKAVKSESGARAVSIPYRSLAGSQTAYSTAFRQAGVIEVNSLAPAVADSHGVRLSTAS
jgi:acyl-CoA synthetase (NDP forming)